MPDFVVCAADGGWLDCPATSRIFPPAVRIAFAASDAGKLSALLPEGG